MFRRIFSAALAAGLLAGVLVSVLQAVTTTPLILQAEVFEAGGGVHDHTGHDHAAPLPSEPEAEDILVRTALTVAANLITGVGFALVVVGAFSLSGRRIDAREGLLWGLGGFAAFTLSPALGLPPELPGTIAADLASRQTWWAFAALGAAGGLAVLAFGKGWWRLPVGLALLVLPHAVGAPHPDAFGGSAPAELVGQFVAKSIVVSAIFWAVLGWLAGGFFRRFS
ncbi:MAG TPA: CbtA family protein [Azospirillum sp.]|nr:CbtA family protein [Azospirillum sp.]